MRTVVLSTITKPKMNLTSHIIEIAKNAGNAIMEVYESADFGIEIKRDQSPLTLADKAANEIICNALLELTPNIPIISEENKQLSYSERKNFTQFWLIDPLDGTKEFVKRNGDFTVNIALIENGESVFGVVYIPVTKEVYWAKKDIGAYKGFGEKAIPLNVASFSKTEENLTIVCSRSHLNEDTQNFISFYKNHRKESRGSSLKFLIIAEGKSHIYPRLAPTMEWDTAAAQIILEEAGGTVLEFKTNTKLHYNKESLLNPFFVASAKCLTNE